jgi:NIPSNAP
VPHPIVSPAQLVEVRRYVLAPGAFDAFVEHFQANLVAPQEALGMDVLGQFRVDGDPDRFVWIRRFLDLPGRGHALAGFYGGPVWAEHGPRANELMVDHTDVHLLVPDPSGPTFATGPLPALATDAPAPPVLLALVAVDRPGVVPPDVARAIDTATNRGPTVVELGRLVTAAVENDFVRLPVHADAHVAWLITDRQDGDAAADAATFVGAQTGRPTEVVRLSPLPGSRLH